LRKPKSSTAAAAAIYMNRDLKDNIIARLDKVHEGTAHIFTDQFFEELSVVTNALDNVHARRYIDTRCVTAKTPLLESGTLGPKGHVQVVLPYKTESYGSMNDPEDNTEIPHCTLKMFPEETLHCVEWARDKFGKIFT
jgi:molybdopterin/thiamine biosynthesis adenylyltransferase